MGSTVQKAMEYYFVFRAKHWSLHKIPINSRTQYFEKKNKIGRKIHIF